MQAVLKLEALRDLVQLDLALPAEMFRPLFHKIFGDQDVARQPTDTAWHLPDGRRVELLVFRWDFLCDVVDQGLVDVLDRGGVRAPCVHRKTVLLGEEFFEQRDVLGFLRDVDHALETNVFVEPD